MSAPVDVLADLRKLANVGEYRELREAMEKCLRPHEREGFADLLGRMVGNASAIAELVEHNAVMRAALSACPCFCQDEDEDGDAATCDRCAALARVGGAK